MAKKMLDVRVGERPAAKARESRVVSPHLNVLFGCCQVYTKVFRRPGAAHYLARCPKCARATRFAVGEGGSASRFWRVD
jgi:hypothetical protein